MARLLNFSITRPELEVNYFVLPGGLIYKQTRLDAKFAILTVVEYSKI